MAYGTVKVDTIIFDQGGTDQNVTASGIYRAITSGVTVTGTISGAVLIGTTTVSGATVTGTAVQGTTVQGVSGTFTSLTGTTTTGTTANFVSGVFTTRISGTTVTGDTGQFTSGTFVSLTGTTITGTTINAVTVSSTTGTFTSLTGTTITGTTINGVTVAATTGSFTSLTGTTIQGTTATYTTGSFTSLTGTTVTGTTVLATTGAFTSLTGTTTQGTTATYTTGDFTSLTGTTIQGTTATYTTGSFTSLTGTTTQGTTATYTTGSFTSLTGTTIQGTTATYTTGSFTSLTGTTTQGTTATYTTGSFTSLTGTTVTGTTASFTSGVFTNISGTTATITSGIIASGTAAAPSLAILADLDTGLFSPGANELAVATNGTQRLFVDASGRLLVGTSASPSAGNGYASKFVVAGNAADLNPESGAMSISRTGILFNSGDTIGSIAFTNPTGNAFAAISCAIDATPGVSDFPGRLTFSTTPDNSATLTERLRITSAGLVGIGTTTPGANLQIGDGSSATLGSTAPYAWVSARALSSAGAATTPQELLRLSWQEGDQNLGEGEGCAINFAASLLADSGTFYPVASIASFKETDGDSLRTSALTFSTSADGSASPTERLRIKSDGESYFQANNTTSAVTINQTGTGNALVVEDNTNPDATPFVIDQNGRSVQGHTVALELNGSGGTPTQQLNGNSTLFAAACYSAVSWSDAIAPPGIFLAKARAGAVGTYTIVPNNQKLGELRFAGADGVEFQNAAIIGVEVDGTPSEGIVPGRIVFDTVNSSGTLTEAMRVNSAQELLIGYTADNGAYKLQVNSQIFATSATIATSDGRYKENVATLNGCIDLVNALRPVSFDWKPQQDITRIDEDGNSVLVREGHNFPDGKQVGFIAQEVQEVLADKPWLGSVIKQNVRPAIEDADGNELAPEEEFFGIAEGNLTAVLTAALQEAIAKINALEARIAALEA
jgi:hypothetical protein